jgi:electron transfer flavoprotein beta subunit
MKWVPQFVDVDPLTGAAQQKDQQLIASTADLAALDCGLRIAEAWSGEVVVASVGPAQVEPMLRSTIAAGASRAVRCDAPLEISSEHVAAALVEAFAGCVVIICGDKSIDRGSGSVPAFLAAKINAAQALGVVDLKIERTGSVQVERRLGAGMRECLRVRTPAVISVEAVTAQQRRSSLAAVLRALDEPIERITLPLALNRAAHAVRVKPGRPRSRVTTVPDPTVSTRERMLAITGMLTERARPQLLKLTPSEAADRILAQLRAWGYLE